jgi:hypothetical protein
VNFWKQEEGCNSQQMFASATDVYGITGRPSVLNINNKYLGLAEKVAQRIMLLSANNLSFK